MYVSDLHPDHEPELYTDYREMLARGSVDAVCIFTGHDSHHQIAIDALEAGKHVAGEKPMGITVKACHRMCEAADRAQRVLGVLENAHYQPLTLASAWAVRDGAIGEVVMVYQGAIGGRAHRPDLVSARTPWRQTKLGTGGGCAVDLGPHVFNRVRTIAGPIRSLSAVWKLLEPDRVLMDAENKRVVEQFRNEVDDVFFANIVFENGAIGHAGCARTARAVALAFPGGTNVWGTAGALSGGNVVTEDGAETSAMDYAREHAPGHEVDAWQPKGITDAFALEELDFIQAIEQGRPMRMNPGEGLLDVALSYAVLESGLAGRSITPDEVLTGAVCEYQRELDEHYGL